MAYNTLYSLLLASLFIQPNLCYGMEHNQDTNNPQGMKRSREKQDQGVNFLVAKTFEEFPDEVIQEIIAISPIQVIFANKRFYELSTGCKIGKSFPADVSGTQFGNPQWQRSKNYNEVTKQAKINGYFTSAVWYRFTDEISNLSPSKFKYLKGAHIKTLNLLSNLIGDDGIEELAPMLQTNVALTSLNLPDNDISAEGALAIAELLKVNSTLRELNLNENKINNDGATAIAKALKDNATLTSLDLSYNEISNAGTVAIAEMLKVNTTLTTLTIGLNEMVGDAEATELAKALKENTTLTKLNIEGHDIGDIGATAFGEMLTVNTSLTSLELWENWDHALSPELTDELMAKFPGRIHF